MPAKIERNLTKREVIEVTFGLIVNIACIYVILVILNSK